MPGAVASALHKHTFKSTMKAENIPLRLFLLSAHFHLTDMSNDNICRLEEHRTNNPQIIGRVTFKDKERENERDKWTTAHCLLK